MIGVNIHLVGNIIAWIAYTEVKICLMIYLDIIQPTVGVNRIPSINHSFLIQMMIIVDEIRVIIGKLQTMFRIIPAKL